MTWKAARLLVLMMTLKMNMKLSEDNALKNVRALLANDQLQLRSNLNQVIVVVLLPYILYVLYCTMSARGYKVLKSRNVRKVGQHYGKATRPYITSASPGGLARPVDIIQRRPDAIKFVRPVNIMQRPLDLILHLQDLEFWPRRLILYKDDQTL
jgi:hypothetical protein